MTFQTKAILLGLLLLGAVAFWNRELARAKAQGALEEALRVYAQDTLAYAQTRDSLQALQEASEARIAVLSDDLTLALSRVAETDSMALRQPEAVRIATTRLPDSTRIVIEAALDTLMISNQACKSALRACVDLTQEQAQLIATQRVTIANDAGLIVRQEGIIARLEAFKPSKGWFACVGGGGLGYAVGARRADLVVGVVCGIRVF